jgi:hypothetical protein
MKQLICIAICTLGRVRVEWGIQIAASNFPLGVGKGFIAVSGLPTEHARNLAVKSSIDLNATHLMFWDDDMIPEDYGALTTLYTSMKSHPNISVISGIYPLRNPTFPEPIVMQEKNGGPFWGWRDGGLHRVYMAGTGFMLIKLSDLPSVPTYEYNGAELPNYFHSDQDAIGDDFYFGNLLQESNIEWWVKGSVRCVQMNLDGTKFDIKKAEEKGGFIEVPISG